MTCLTFTVLGKAETKGSTKSSVVTRKDGTIVFKNGRPVVRTRNDNDGCYGWEQQIKLLALKARSEAREQMWRELPVALDVAFYTPRNKGHFGTGRNAGRLLPSAPLFPAKRPDVDKKLRAVMDAMTGVLYDDDGQVVMVRALDLWGEPARAEIRVWSMLSVEDRAPVEIGEQAQLALVA